MKKGYMILLTVLILAGCGTTGNQSKKVNVTSQSERVDVPGQQSVNHEDKDIQLSGQLGEKEGTNNEGTGTQLEEDYKMSGEGRYVGAIGEYPIHVELNLETLTGSYSYDKYKDPIAITGEEEIDANGRRKIYFTEETGHFEGIVRSNSYIQGYWSSTQGNKIYPMYFIEEGYDIDPPKVPSEAVQQFTGEWTADNSGYFSFSKGEVHALFDDLIYYDIYGQSGANEGGIGGLAIRQKGEPLRFKEELCDWNDETVYFEFTLENDHLLLESNDYTFRCGVGVSMGESYSRGVKKIAMPTPLEIGIVDTKEKEDIFIALVGEHYEDFIASTMGVNYETIKMGDEEVQVASAWFRSCADMSYYMISEQYMYVATAWHTNEYYTNDPRYANEMPEAMLEWAERWGGNFNMHYK